MGAAVSVLLALIARCIMRLEVKMKGPLDILEIEQLNDFDISNLIQFNAFLFYFQLLDILFILIILTFFDIFLPRNASERPSLISETVQHLIFLSYFGDTFKMGCVS